jgi:hypothetical protein
MALKKYTFCENMWYELKLMWHRFYGYYDNYMNPPCEACGVKKEKKI